MTTRRPAAFCATRRIAAASVRVGEPLAGLISGTRVETAAGWRAVETLGAGDFVFTRDGRLRRIERAERSLIQSGAAQSPARRVLVVPGGAIGNCAPFLLMPDQLLAFDMPGADRLRQREPVFVPGKALARFRGITPVGLDRPAVVVNLRFKTDETIWANTGVLAHCMARGADGILGKLDVVTIPNRAQTAEIIASLEEFSPWQHGFDRTAA